MTKFIATRNFLRRPGVDVVKGELLELDDTEAALLVSLCAVEPVNAADRKRVVSTPKISWEVPEDARERQQTEREPRLRMAGATVPAWSVVMPGEPGYRPRVH